MYIFGASSPDSVYSIVAGYCWKHSTGEIVFVGSPLSKDQY